jgi:hypothetical protein
MVRRNDIVRLLAPNRMSRFAGSDGLSRVVMVMFLFYVTDALLLLVEVTGEVLEDETVEVMCMRKPRL